MPDEETLRFMKTQQEVNEKINDNITEVKVMVTEIRSDVKSIHEQTKRTNGRVDDLETLTNNYKGMWKRQLEKRMEDEKFVRNMVYKIVAAVSIIVLLGTNMDKIIKLFL